MPADDVALVEANQPGFTLRKIAMRSSQINSRLRKRYGNAPTVGNGLPWGRVAPALVASGTNPTNGQPAPAPVSLQGVPILGSQVFLLQVVVAGVPGDGIGQFRWSRDGGITWGSSGTPMAAQVQLTGTGCTALFTAGAQYGTDNVYASDTCVPRAILRWLVALVTVDLYDRRGRNGNAPALVTVQANYDQALAELKEAADSKEGLFDLPVSEDLDSAVTTGGVLSHADASPYVAMYEGDRRGMNEDDCHTYPGGTYGGPNG